MRQKFFTFHEPSLKAFFEQVPALYRKAQATVHEPYQRLLYTVEHAFGPEDLDAIDGAFGFKTPQWADGSRLDAIRLLDSMRYPETIKMANLRAVPGLDLSQISHYLHFFHHAYPLYTREACRGLDRLGATVPYVKVRDPDTYGLYITAIEELKERVPFWDVPETNVYLTRILQGALHAYGAEAKANLPVAA
jgi:hypothetical protein